MTTTTTTTNAFTNATADLINPTTTTATCSTMLIPSATATDVNPSTNIVLVTCTLAAINPHIM
eukprot:8762456-Pyramimonas_sp.AAC.1